MKFNKILIYGIVLAAIVFAVLLAMRTDPILVDVEPVHRAGMEVSLSEIGRTRIKQKYIVSAPVAGRLRRIRLREGDKVNSSITTVASIESSDPALLDARTHAQSIARVSVAETAVKRSETQLEQAKIEFQRAEADYQRAQSLKETQAISLQEFDSIQARYYTSRQVIRTAEFDWEISRYELQTARAAVQHSQVVSSTDLPIESATPAIENFDLVAPIDGVVLRLFQESSTIVTPGMPIMEIGQPNDLEVVVDFLSTDVVKILPGAQVYIEHWGGDVALPAVVRRIEPSAFEKISALGIEEQRVNVIIEFENGSHQQTPIGDGYRIEARVVIWQDENVLQVPINALFRDQGNWAVFRAINGRAILTPIQIGQRNNQYAEVLSGLSEQDLVIAFPSDQIRDHSPIRQK